MGIRPIRFRVESNKAKSSFWYTLVAGNGDTVMTSKASYSTRAKAKRAAKNQIKALGESQLVLEYEEGDGSWVQEEVPTVVSSGPLVSGTMPKAQIPQIPSVSFVPAAERLNPNS